MPMISIVIASYNYARYVGATVESALVQTMPCEVIVVDDGSTDNSLEVLAQFGDRITVIAQQNVGEAAAKYTGFQRAKGDVIIFLDSDDVLYPQCAATLATRFAPGIVKVQACLATIGPDGESLNSVHPVYQSDLTSQAIKYLAVTVGSYPTPSSSGNAYSRDFVNKVFPVADGRLRNNSDVYLSRLAPLYGDVVVVPEVLGGYRVHGTNYWAAGDKSAKYWKYVAEDLAARDVFLDHAKRRNVAVAAANTLGSMPYMENRVLSLRLTPERHPLPSDRRWNLLFRAVGAALRSPEHPLAGRVVWASYLLFLGLAPRTVLRHHLQRMRVAGNRSRLIDWLAALSHRGRSNLSETAAAASASRPFRTWRFT